MENIYIGIMTYRGRIGRQGMIFDDQVVVFSTAALPLQDDVEKLVDEVVVPLPDGRAQQTSGQSSVNVRETRYG